MIDKDLMLMKMIRASAVAGMIACVAFIITSAYANAEVQQPDKYWVAPDIYNNNELRKIPVYYVNEEFKCVDHEEYVNGCYVLKKNAEYIILVKDKEFTWAKQGCTVHDHEWFHAAGYEHGVGPLSYTCPNPNIITTDNTNMSYDDNNYKHWDPMYEHVPRELNPTMIKWE